MGITKTIFDILFDVALLTNVIIFVPQLIKILRLKDTRELSFISFFGVFLLQLIFGIHAYLYRDFAFMTGMIGAMLVSGSIAILILTYRNH